MTPVAAVGERSEGVGVGGRLQRALRHHQCSLRVGMCRLLDLSTHRDPARLTCPSRDLQNALRAIKMYDVWLSNIHSNVFRESNSKCFSFDQTIGQCCLS